MLGVVAGYSDTCCGGCKDITKHWFERMWLSVKCAPLKDLFHGLKNVSNAVRPHHELSAVFSRALSNASLAFVPSSIDHVLSLYKNKESYDKAKCNDLLKKEMLTMSKYRKKIKNVVRKKSDHARHVKSVYNAIVEQD